MKQRSLVAGLAGQIAGVGPDGLRATLDTIYDGLAGQAKAEKARRDEMVRMAASVAIDSPEARDIRETLSRLSR